MKTIITVENIAKRYRIGAPKAAQQSVRDVLTRALKASVVRRRGQANSVGEVIWALKNINFEVKAGEVVGLIGHNGAGKSTLLKILSRITEPTTGRIALYGRVGSLLEVGTGFHPELTGRENVFLNGAMLGMRRAEIARKFDEIVQFSEIEKFIDTPVKFYSSGMYARLAFAVAAHLEPEILIIDEVLAVGDAAFQRKCLGKMSEVSKEGRTVLFVSHNMTAMQSLCSRLIWLHKGETIEEGRPSDIAPKYLKDAFSSSDISERIWDDVRTAPGNETVRLRSARVRPVAGTPADSINIETPLKIEFEYWNLKSDAVLNLSLLVVNEEGVVLFNTGPINEPVWNGHPLPSGLFCSECDIPSNLLNDGVHRVHLLVVEDQTTIIFRYDDVLVFDIQELAEQRKSWYGKWIGAVRPNLEWRTELVERSESTYSVSA